MPPTLLINQQRWWHCSRRCCSRNGSQSLPITWSSEHAILVEDTEGHSKSSEYVTCDGYHSADRQLPPKYLVSIAGCDVPREYSLKFAAPSASLVYVHALLQELPESSIVLASHSSQRTDPALIAAALSHGEIRSYPPQPQVLKDRLHAREQASQLLAVKTKVQRWDIVDLHVNSSHILVRVSDRKSVV